MRFDICFNYTSSQNKNPDRIWGSSLTEENLLSLNMGKINFSNVNEVIVG